MSICSFETTELVQYIKLAVKTQQNIIALYCTYNMVKCQFTDYVDTHSDYSASPHKKQDMKTYSESLRK